MQFAATIDFKLLKYHTMKNNIFHKTKRLLAIAVLALSVNSLSAGILTTTFSSNNGYAGNMFDVTTFGNDLQVTGLSINTSTSIGNNVTAELYTKVGSYNTSISTASDWTLMDTKTFASAGKDNGSFFDVNDFMLSSGTTYGFYVNVLGEQGIKYTNGSNTYANSDLQITTGIGRGDGAFTGSVFSPRTWNGSIHYNAGATKVPNTAYTFALLGFGLITLVGIKRKIRR